MLSLPAAAAAADDDDDDAVAACLRISHAVDSYQSSLQPAVGLHASIHPAYGRRSIAHSPRALRPETEALSRMRISGITRAARLGIFVLGPWRAAVLSERGPVC